MIRLAEEVLQSAILRSACARIGTVADFSSRSSRRDLPRAQGPKPEATLMCPACPRSIGSLPLGFASWDVWSMLIHGPFLLATTLVAMCRRSSGIGPKWPMRSCPCVSAGATNSAPRTRRCGRVASSRAIRSAPREWPQGNGPRECCRDAARSLRRVLSPRPRETGARVPKGRPSSPSDPWPPTSAASAARVNHQGSGRSVSWSSLSSTDCDPVYPINLATLS